MAQIESALKRAISVVLSQGLSDPRLGAMVSVTRVNVSPDLHQAGVYVSVLPEEAGSRVMHGLRHAAVHIHREVSQKVDIRRVPHLEFYLDETLKHQAEVDGAILRARAKDEASRKASGRHGSGASKEEGPGASEDGCGEKHEGQVGGGGGSHSTLTGEADIS